MNSPTAAADPNAALVALQMANKAHHDLCMGAPCLGDRQRILIELDLIMNDLRKERR